MMTNIITEAPNPINCRRFRPIRSMKRIDAMYPGNNPTAVRMRFPSAIFIRESNADCVSVAPETGFPK